MYDIIELPTLPRDGNALKALLNSQRYQRRRARRQRVVNTLLLVGLAVVCMRYWSQLEPLLTRLDTYTWVAIVAGVVFVVSTVRLLRRRRVRRTQQPGGRSHVAA